MARIDIEACNQDIIADLAANTTVGPIERVIDAQNASSAPWDDGRSSSTHHPARRKMKIWYLLRTAATRLWKSGDECLYQNARSNELADRLGYDHAWRSSIILEEYSHPSAPESLLPQPASETKTSGWPWHLSGNDKPSGTRRRTSRYLICCRTGAASSAWASGSITELSSSPSRWRRSAKSSRRPFRPSSQCSRMTEHHGKYFNLPSKCLAEAPAKAASAVGVAFAARHAGEMR